MRTVWIGGKREKKLYVEVKKGVDMVGPAAGVYVSGKPQLNTLATCISVLKQ